MAIDIKAYRRIASNLNAIADKAEQEDGMSFLSTNTGETHHKWFWHLEKPEEEPAKAVRWCPWCGESITPGEEGPPEKKEPTREYVIPNEGFNLGEVKVRRRPGCQTIRVDMSECFRYDGGGEERVQGLGLFSRESSKKFICAILALWELDPE